ncbi:RICIN domain-containing protein [Streptomyces sp. NPDC089919]|uniref:RICIN domain-containing protein n=1 Tax=Streptomyces sp. NPDC089919 TaxID=3155188 RepID=UPI0034271C9D
MKGATGEANELAGLLAELTGELTVRELARRYGGSKTLWSEYRCGARIIPLGRLNGVVRDRVRDARGLAATLDRARLLHEAALLADVAQGPVPDVAEALRRAEEDLEASVRLVRGLVGIITMLLPAPGSEGTGEAAATGAERAEVVPYELVDRAVDRLGTAWAVGHAARRVTEGLLAQERAALPAAEAAESELVVALARTDGALEHLEWEVVQLVAEAAELRRGAGASATDPVEGVVLERLDRTVATGPVRSGPRRDPVRRLGSAAIAFVAAAVLGVAALVTTAVVVLAGREPAGTAAAAPTVQPVGARPSVTLPVPAPGVTVPASPGPTAPAGTVPSARPPGTVPAPPPRPAAPAPTPPAATSPTPSASPTPTSTPTPTPSATRPPAGLLRFANAGSGLCLAVPPGSSTPADALVQAGCVANPERSWYLTQESTGADGPVYSVRNRYSGLCLSVEGARTTNDVPVTQYLCGDRQGLFPDQFWVLRHDGALRAWQLLNLNSGKCAAARPGAQPGEQVTQQECRPDPWSSWRV